MHQAKFILSLALLLSVCGLLYLSDGCFPAIGLNCGVSEHTCILQNYTTVRIGCYPCYNVLVECGSCTSTDAKFDTIEEVDNNFIIGELKTFYIHKNKCFYELPSQENTIFGFVILIIMSVVILSVGFTYVRDYMISRTSSPRIENKV